MARVAIPRWNLQGVLPPRNTAAPTSFDRSPYNVAITDVALRFATSPQRCTILEGFLRFREAVNQAGLEQGFQWLDGSFMEDIETTEQRPPGDIDVVTLYHLPQGVTQQGLFSAHPDLFDPVQAKANYHVDAYFLQINVPEPEPLIGMSLYWYSLWSQRRNDVWKGYLQVDLAPADNAATWANLAAMRSQGGTP